MTRTGAIGSEPTRGLTADADAALMTQFRISPLHGFLPSDDPLTVLPPEYEPWESIVADLPKLLAADRVPTMVDALPLLDTSSLAGGAELERAMLVLSYIAHAYVWGGREPIATTPSSIAIPWDAVARRIGRPSVLSYASHALVNWRRYDRTRPPVLGNSARLLNFCGGLDEDWFVLVHVEIEAKAAPALLALLDAKRAIAAADIAGVTKNLEVVATTVRSLAETLRRMPEKCDPYIYYNRVRQYIFGWHDQPALPDGLAYQLAAGVVTRKLRGETGAQSAIIPSIDALCRVDHSRDPFAEHLAELRSYMPQEHRAFIAYLEDGPSVRELLVGAGSAASAGIEAYNAVLTELAAFRRKHLELAGAYIHSQSQRTRANPVAVGTGGTPFMRYLRDHMKSTEQQLLRVPALLS